MHNLQIVVRVFFFFCNVFCFVYWVISGQFHEDLVASKEVCVQKNTPCILVIFIKQSHLLNTEAGEGGGGGLNTTEKWWYHLWTAPKNALYKLLKNHWVTPLFENGPVRNKLIATFSLDHPVTRVTKGENFPDSKIFVAKTFRIKRVNRVNFQIRDKCALKVVLQDFG